MPYLNETGLTTLWNKIKANFAGVDDLSITHGASDATITDTLKTPGSGATLSTDSITIKAATTSTAGLMSSSDKTMLDNLKTTVDGLTASGGEPNQNAFSNVKVGSTTIQADSKTDTLELAASTNITLTPDATNDKVTVAHSTPTGAAAKTSGLYKITTDSQGHVTGATAVAKEDITALGIPGSDTNTDTKVTQTVDTTTNGTFPILLGNNNNTETATVKKTGSNIGISPKDGIILTPSIYVENMNDIKNMHVDENFIMTSNGTDLITLISDMIHLHTTELANGSIAYTQAAGDNSTKIATTAFVSTAVANAKIGAAMFQGTVADNATVSESDYKKGWYWVVSTAGTYVGETCEVGDMIFCVNDKGSAYSVSDFKVLQTNITSIPDATINALS